MDGPRQESEIHENSQDSKRLSEGITQRQISQNMAYFFTAVRIFGIIVLVFYILSGLFKPDISEVIAIILVFFLILSAVLGRSIKFYCKQTRCLGFVTELAFIIGVVFSVISAISGYSYSMEGLLAFSFVIAPGLGIVNRAVKLKREETKKIYYTIIEMFILGISLVFAIWILLKLK